MFTATPKGVCVGLTFELSGRRRQDARPGLAKMYRVPPDRAWWPAVGAPVERVVRPQRVPEQFETRFLTGLETLRGCLPRTASQVHQ